jgi:3-hydroxyisobutyrate dehydrogenase-like beta-hydroxyacid dehydrogenase
MSKPTVGWIGLGAMGQGMAQVSHLPSHAAWPNIQSLLSQGFKVKAYDVYAPSLEAAVKVGAEPCATPADAGNVDILGLMVVNALQVEDALFGSGQVAAGMS